MLPTAGANMSTLVASTNCLASSGVVSTPTPSGAFFKISEEVPIHPDFSFEENGGVDRFNRLDGVFGLDDILFEAKSGTIKNDFIEPCFGCFFRLRYRMSMVCVEENRLAVFFPNTSHQRGGLANADERAFPFRDSDNHRQIQAAGGCFNRVERHQIRKIKMANCNSVMFRFLQGIF
jgi:hypothetical protein